MKRKVTMHISKCAYRSRVSTIKSAGRNKKFPKTLCGLKPNGKGSDVFFLPVILERKHDLPYLFSYEEWCKECLATPKMSLFFLTRSDL